MTTRSTTLVAFRTTVAAGAPVVYVCPSTSITLIKSVGIFNGGPVDETPAVYARRPSVPAIVRLSDINVPTLKSIYKDLWVVIAPGDTIVLSYTQVGIDLWISGALLPI